MPALLRGKDLPSPQRKTGRLPVFLHNSLTKAVSRMHKTKKELQKALQTVHLYRPAPESRGSRLTGRSLSVNTRFRPAEAGHGVWSGWSAETESFRLPGDRPQNRSRFCSLRVLIAQNPVGKRLIQAIFGAAKFAGIQVGLPTPATVRKIAPDSTPCGF